MLFLGLTLLFFFLCVCVCVCVLLVSNYLFRVRQKVIQNYAGSWAFFLSFATFFLMFCSLLTFPFSNFCCSSYAFTFLLPCCTLCCFLASLCCFFVFFCVCVCVCFLLVSNYLFRVRQKVIQNYAGSWAFFLSFATFFLMFCSLLTFPFSNFCCSSYAFTFLLPCCTFTEVLPIFHHLSTSKTN